MNIKASIPQIKSQNSLIKAKIAHLHAASAELLRQFIQAILFVVHYDTLVWYSWISMDPRLAAQLKAELTTKTEAARAAASNQQQLITINGIDFEVMSMTNAWWVMMATKEASQYPWVIKDKKSGICLLINKNFSTRVDLSPSIIYRADSTAIQRFADMIAMEDYILSLTKAFAIKIPAFRLSTVHLAIDLIRMPTAIWTEMVSVMSVQTAARKGVINIKPQAGVFSGFSVGDSTNHRVQFYSKIDEIKDKHPDKGTIQYHIDRLTNLWGAYDPNVTRIEIQLKDYLNSDELKKQGLAVTNAREWLAKFADIMTLYCSNKFMITEDENMSIPHPAWKVIIDLWRQATKTMVYRHSNPISSNATSNQMSVTQASSNAGSQGGIIPVASYGQLPPSSLPQSKADGYAQDAVSMIGRLQKFFGRNGIPTDDPEMLSKILEQMAQGKVPAYQSWVP